MSRYIDPKLCLSGSAFRSASLFDITLNKSRSFSGKLKLLILIPYYIPEAVEILESMADLLPEYSDELQIIVRCHLDYDKNTILSYTASKDKNYAIQFSNQSLLDDFKDTDAVIASGKGATVESYSLGIPTIIVARNNI